MALINKINLVLWSTNIHTVNPYLVRCCYVICVLFSFQCEPVSGSLLLHLLVGLPMELCLHCWTMYVWSQHWFRFKCCKAKALRCKSLNSGWAGSCSATMRLSVITFDLKFQLWLGVIRQARRRLPRQWARIWLAVCNWLCLPVGLLMWLNLEFWTVWVICCNTYVDWALEFSKWSRSAPLSKLRTKPVTLNNFIR